MKMKLPMRYCGLAAGHQAMLWVRRLLSMAAIQYNSSLVMYIIHNYHAEMCVSNRKGENLL